jgi:hypothetical protein
LTHARSIRLRRHGSFDTAKRGLQGRHFERASGCRCTLAADGTKVPYSPIRALRTKRKLSTDRVTLSNASGWRGSSSKLLGTQETPISRSNGTKTQGVPEVRGRAGLGSRLASDGRTWRPRGRNQTGRLLPFALKVIIPTAGFGRFQTQHCHERRA